MFLLILLRQIVTYQFKTTFKEFDSKQQPIDYNVISTPEPILENQTVNEIQK